MTMTRRQRSPRSASSGELAELRARLADAEQTLCAIRNGEVDAVMVAGKSGPQVFTLEGAEHSYRMLIESMNEGALTLTPDTTILYANQCFARMVQSPQEQVMGSSFRRFLSSADQARIRPLLKQSVKSGSKLQVLLSVGNGSKTPVQISIRPLPKQGFKHAPIGMVVTDMTEARRSEELLRTLTHRVVHVLETERRRVALELHDHITQLLCAVLVRSQTLANSISARDGPSKREAIALRQMLGHAADEVERISRDLRPGVLDELGLAAVLRVAATQFANRTGVVVKLTCVRLNSRLAADVELALYRILQETLKNVEKHAHARHVTIHLARLDEIIQLTISDDGIGFDPDHLRVKSKGKGGFGLLGMRERASSVGGVLKITSVRRVGTEIDVHIPLRRVFTAANGVAETSFIKD